MEIISFKDIVDIAEKEDMVNIWIEFEKGSLLSGFTYGFDGKNYYCLGDRLWQPMYVKSLEELVDYASMFHDVSCFLKIK